MNTIDELALSCIFILNKLIDLYRNCKISKDEFDSNTKLKAIFLINNIDNITDQEIKLNSYKALNSYACYYSNNEWKNSTYNTPK